MNLTGLLKAFSHSATPLVFYCCLIGWASPYITIGGHAVFASITIRGLAILVMIAVHYRSQAHHFVTVHHGDLISALITTVRAYFKKTTQWYTDGRRRYITYWHQLCYRINDASEYRRLRKMPWFMLIGPPRSGTTTLLGSSDMQFIEPEQISKEAVQIQKQHLAYLWRFTREAVFVCDKVHDKEDGMIHRKRFCRYLKRARPHRPLNGLIITLNVSDLVSPSRDSQDDVINSLEIKIKDLHTQLSSAIPIYLVLTQSDVINGFVDIFNDLSQEELGQVWGMTFSITECDQRERVLNQFTLEFNQLITRLQGRVFTALDTEKSLTRRQQLACFPQQLLLFKKPLQKLIDALFQLNNRRQAMLFRGLYFTSARQGAPHDFLLSSFGKSFNLTQGVIQTAKTTRESYFISQLFHEVIIPEGRYLGDTVKRKRRNRIRYKGSLIVAPMTIVLGISGLCHAYQKSRDRTISIQQYVNTYHARYRNLHHDDPDLVATLPILNTLDRANTISHQLSSLERLFYTNHAIREATQHALNRYLRVFFNPRIAYHLENGLKKAQVDNTNTLYARLKGYLAFSPSSHTSAAAIIAPMEFDWRKQYANNPAIQQQLRYFLQRTTLLEPDKLPLNRPLINTVREKLQQIVPAQRAYGLLQFKAAASQLTDFDCRTAIGDHFAAVFTLNNDVPSTIPGLYTDTGYHTVFQPQQARIADQVSADNREVGLDASRSQPAAVIQHQIRSTYLTTYLNQWDSLIGHIRITSFPTTAIAVNRLTILSSDESPLKRLLDHVIANTRSIGEHHDLVKQHFQRLNNYTNNLGAPPTYADTKKALRNLCDYLAAIEHTANRNQAYFNAAVAIIQSRPGNPLVLLSQQEQHLPAALRRWLHQIDQSTWRLIEKHALSYINTAWRTQIYHQFTELCQGHYPFDRHANAEVSIQDFTHLFAQDGSFELFFKHYLTPFINTDNEQWALLTHNHFQLHLTSQCIHLFHLIHTLNHHIFDDNNHLRLGLTIRPLTLAKSAAAVTLSLGSQQLRYQHGPQQSITVNWPMADSEPVSQISLTDFHHHTYRHHYEGAWSLFKLFNSPISIMTKHHSNNTWTTVLGQHRATFCISHAETLNALHLLDLSSIRVPPTLN